MQSKSNLEKPCSRLKVARMVAFNGSYENTLKYWNQSYIYPVGSNIIIENGLQEQHPLKGHDSQVTAVALGNNGNSVATQELF